LADVATADPAPDAVFRAAEALTQRAIEFRLLPVLVHRKSVFPELPQRPDRALPDDALRPASIDRAMLQAHWDVE
jgi:hypothetical protein